MALKLPGIRLPGSEWPADVISAWQVLTTKAEALQRGVGKGNDFDHMVEELQLALTSTDGARIKKAISTRLGARALTYLWLEDNKARRSLNPRSIALLLECQQPRLSQIPLINLVSLYFRFYDNLDEVDQKLGSIRESASGVLADVITMQLKLLPEQKFQNDQSVLHNLKRHANEIMAKDAPALLVRQARKQKIELDEYFKKNGLIGFDKGRFGDICRAIYYLETLKEIPVGESHAVFAELEKNEVNMAIFEGQLRIGHRALEILIDRSHADPGDNWRNFILNIAGDPRIASTASGYRQWWLPIGEERIEKVRGWLSREDLKLFLKAVEQYGIQSGDDELQRMFPERKKFLEGLFDQNLVKSTRLMMGSKAHYGVKRILGSEMRSSYIKLGSSLSDKAVIYLNCGDFHIIEGSHSFKVWVYLNLPSPIISDYGITSLDHFDLTVRIPNYYRQNYPELPMGAFVHNQKWRYHVIKILSDNGIQLDVEGLMTKNDYKLYLRNHGIQIVNSIR